MRAERGDMAYKAAHLEGVYDVVVVGGGPAGSVAAFVARRLGLKVLVVDRLEPPREKPCGGGLTPRTWRLLERLGLQFPWYGKCDAVEVTAAGLRYVHKGDPILITRRPQFDRALLEQSGADFVRDHVVAVRDGTVVGRGGEYSGRVVVGADGATSTVARSIGAQNYRRERTHAIAYMTIASGSAQGTCIIDFDYVKRRTGLAGYAWIFPLGDLGANVGAGAGWGPWRDLRGLVTEFAEMFGLKAGEVRGHPLSLGYVGSLGSGSVLLAGEAAGLVDAATGEGIYYAVASGALAGQAAYIALKVLGKASHAASVYSQLVRPYVEEVRRSRALSRLMSLVGYTRPIARAIGRRLVALYRALYVGEATYGPLLITPSRH